jgi:hypothetical protein
MGEVTKSAAATLNLAHRHALNPARVELVLTTLFRSNKVSCRFDMKEQRHVDAGHDWADGDLVRQWLKRWALALRICTLITDASIRIRPTYLVRECMHRRLIDFVRVWSPLYLSQEALRPA